MNNNLGDYSVEKESPQSVFKNTPLARLVLSKFKNIHLYFPFAYLNFSGRVKET